MRETGSDAAVKGGRDAGGKEGQREMDEGRVRMREREGGRVRCRRLCEFGRECLGHRR